MKLPPLPPCTVGLGAHRWAFGDDDMKAYGALCARAALEEAADKCSDEYRTPDGWGRTAADRRCVELIKSIQIEGETPCSE